MQPFPTYQKLYISEVWLSTAISGRLSAPVENSPQLIAEFRDLYEDLSAELYAEILRNEGLP
jgi:hypothetical protein